MWYGLGYNLYGSYLVFLEASILQTMTYGQLSNYASFPTKKEYKTQKGGHLLY